MDETLAYNPPKSVQGFLRTDKFGSLICGPVGSTKTTAGIMKIAYHAQRMAKARDGVRRSRCIWIRNTRQMLYDSSIPDFLKWFPSGVAGDFAKTDSKFFLRMCDQDGVPVECEVLFRGLDDANDVRRLLSLQASFAVLDEFREINKDIFEAVQGRLGRYPDGMLVPHKPEWGVDSKGNPVQGCVTDEGKPNSHIWGMTNPPDMMTFWEDFLSNPPDNFDVFFQPSGLSPEADWTHLLPTDYYENLAQGKSADYIDVYINAQFGKSLSGQPVFKSFNRDLHISKEPLNPMPGAPLLIGVDAGLTPSAVLGQVAYDGRVIIHDVLTSKDMGAVRFINEKLKPLLANKYMGFKSKLVIDPAAFQRVQTDERCVADMFKAAGFEIKPARTNSIAARIAAVEQFLTRTVDGKPAFLVNKACGSSLVHALAGKYRYKTNTKGETDDKPEKNEWSHEMDALQYLCLHADGGALFGASAAAQRREVKPSPHRWAI